MMDRANEPMTSGESTSAPKSGPPSVEAASDAAGVTSNPSAAANKPTAPTAAAAKSNTSKAATKKKLTVDQAREKLEVQVKSLADQETVEAICLLLKDHDGLKEKVPKLKSLLGRSAKAQREAKVDLEATQKRLDQALREIERLNKKIQHLSNRPTHMELLADFETNFDRALLSVGKNQPGGEDTAPSQPSSMMPLAASTADPEAAVVESLLMQELAESKQRIEKLESLNAALVHRSSQLEGDTKQLARERDGLSNQMARLELEKRMAVMEAEQAVKQMQEKAASLEEMQMEIDLVTKSSVKANARAKHGEDMIKNVKTDKEHTQKLESQVQLLKEWALASSEAKTLAQERVRMLENQLKAQAGGNKNNTGGGDDGAREERVLFNHKASLVIGAGDVGHRVFSLTSEQAKSVRLSERVVLRWHFDLTTDTVDIPFSVMRGNCDTPAKIRGADYIVKDRVVTGGAEGEIEDAFTSQQACTMEWNNSQSWVRPKTVKYTVSAVVISD